MFAWRDVNVSQLENVGNSITFGGQLIPPIPTGETLTYARAGVDGCLAGPSSSGNAWLYWPSGSGWIQLNVKPVGGWGVVIDDTFVAWQEQGVGTVRSPIVSAHFSTLLPNPWQATGLLDMVNGVVRSDDRSQPFSVTWGGVTYLCQLWMTRSGRTVMQANNMPGGSGVVVWDADTQQLWRVYSGDYQVPPRLSEDGRTVALTGDMAQGFIADTSWTLEPQEQPLPPITNIVRKTSPVIFGPFTQGPMPSWGNCYIDESTGGSVLVGPNGQRWQVYDAETGQGPTDPAVAKCIFGPIDKLAALPFTPTRYDLMFVYCVPNAGESADEMFQRFVDDFVWISGEPSTAGVVCYIRTNNVLSETDIANGIEACSDLQCPVLIFRAYGSDVPQSAIDRVTYWRNGQPCPPQVLPPQPPQPSRGLAARKMILS